MVLQRDLGYIFMSVVLLFVKGGCCDTWGCAKAASSQQIRWAWQNCWDAAPGQPRWQRPRAHLPLECGWMCFPSEWMEDLPSFQVKCKWKVLHSPIITAWESRGSFVHFG